MANPNSQSSLMADSKGKHLLTDQQSTITDAAAGTASTITDNSGGAASTTIALGTNIATLTDSSGGTPADTLVASVGALVSDTVVVDSSGNGVGQTTNLTLIPAQSVLINVEAVVLTDMNGDTTKTFEVGVSGNADAYIDSSDFDPAGGAGTKAGSASGTNNDVKTVQYLAAATQLEALWTNNASASTGSTEVTTQYLVIGESSADAALTDNNVSSLTEELTAQKALNTVLLNAIASIAAEYNKLVTSDGTSITAINAVNAALESHGLTADS